MIISYLWLSTITEKKRTSICRFLLLSFNSRAAFKRKGKHIFSRNLNARCLWYFITFFSSLFIFLIFYFSFFFEVRNVHCLKEAQKKSNKKAMHFKTNSRHPKPKDKIRSIFRISFNLLFTK